MPFRIALVVARAARRLDEDLAPLEAALRGAGVDAEILDWDDATADWASFDLALLRSVWDYSKRLPEFIQWAEHVSTLTRLLNPARLIRWNCDKHYLTELRHAGVPTVPSHFVEPGEEAATGLQRFFALHPGAEFVVKPTVGVGSNGAKRFLRADVEQATAHAQRLLDGGKPVVLQPYLARVDESGETAMLYYAGEFSHAVRKGPLLRRGEPPIRALFDREHISARVPEKDELDVAARALAAQPFGTLLYARVDLIRNSDGTPCVLEVELMEPSMFFAFAPGALERFVSAVLRSLEYPR